MPSNDELNFNRQESQMIPWWWSKPKGRLNVACERGGRTENKSYLSLLLDYTIIIIIIIRSRYRAHTSSSEICREI